MRPTVYIETTIPSYYYESRMELQRDIARTRQWWDAERSQYNCFASLVVLDELSTGEYPDKARCLSLVADMPLLALTREIEDIAELYRSRKLMPRRPAADALHVAIASYYRMEYLVTWNCRHLANVNKARHLMVINQSIGLSVPQLVTPHSLQPWEEQS